MKTLITKTKLAFLPLLFLGCLFITGYCFFYWLFCIKLQSVGLKKDMIEIWIPFALAFAILLIFIRPRLHLLRLDKDNGRIRGLYYLVGAATLWVPVIFGIAYIDTATGKLTELSIITELGSKPATKYYKPSSFVLRKDLVGIQPVSSLSGKYNQYRNFDLYLAIPFLGDLYDTMHAPAAYLSVNYHTQISSKIQGAEREKAWSDFWEQSFERFDNERIPFTYLERHENTSERDHLISAAQKCSLFKTGTPVVVLKPVNNPFNQRTGNNLRNLCLAFGTGLCLWFIMISIPGLHTHKVKKFRGNTKREISIEFRKAYRTFKPTPGFIATPVILALNLFIFIAMVFMGRGFMSFPAADLVRWGALYQPLIHEGQWWRLLTNMFLHGGVMHLFMNMVSLYLAGIFLEAFIGTKSFVAGYLISGVLAALASIWWHDDPVVGVGASGAIFGLYGMLLSLIASRLLDPVLNKMLIILLACTAGYSLIVGFAMEGIDNSAHLGGLVAGFLLGFIYSRNIKNKVTMSGLQIPDNK